jgi:hypothetical protein
LKDWSVGSMQVMTTMRCINNEVKRRMIMTMPRWTFSLIVGCLLWGIAGCGDDDDNDGNSAGTADCAYDLEGEWLIVSHCQDSQVGDMYHWEQDGCNITYADNYPGWTSTISEDGTVTSTGPAGENDLTCVGELDGDSIELSCTPGGCEVRIERQ